MSNIRLAQDVLQGLLNQGVREIVLCAGARNAPLVTALSRENPFKTYSFFEERSAGFFALGRILASRLPVAVITTSGTAVAELLPAVIEADQQGLPLVLVTADRPKSYRGSGAPQTIVQPGLFSHYVENSWDFELESGAFRISPRRPSHINVCFDEPLIDAEPQDWCPPSPLPQRETPENQELALWKGGRRPLIIVSGLSLSDRERVLPWLRACQRPLFLEATSQLRGHPDLHDWEILAGEASLSSIDFDSVIRIGGVPTLRFWRDLEKSDLPVLHFSDLPFLGLARGGLRWPLASLPVFEEAFEPLKSEELACDRERAQILRQLLHEYPLSEPGWVHWLSGQIPSGARVYLGNSLPIREWDLSAMRFGALEVFANRGANGIDGQLSTFFGVADASQNKSNWCLVGDLTALYDLSSPWALRERPLPHAEIVLINNGGGKIFERIFKNALFENRHALRFGPWAAMWNLDYLNLERPQALLPASGVRLIEIRPCPEQTVAFWRKWEQ